MTTKRSKHVLIDDIHREVADRLMAEAKLRARGIPVMAGGATAPTAHPLGPPTIVGTEYRVDLMLRQPTRINTMVMDITQQRFFVDRVFTSAGGVTGGAVVFDMTEENELYLSRDIQRVAPGGEFPIVTSERRVPQVAEVEKWGGKVFITVEARDRNDLAEFTKQIRQLGNTIVRKINQRGVEVLMAAITAHSRTMPGNDWSSIVTTPTLATNHDLMPAYDFGKLQMLNEQGEMGIVYDLVILNPQEYLALTSVYADRLPAVLAAYNLSIFVTNRVTPGTALVVASGQVGEMRVEQPLMTETWYEEKTQREWIQSSVRPLMFVNNALAVMELTGLAG